MNNEFEKIEKFSWRYHILKGYVDFFFKLFYKIRYYGKENVDLKKTLIFAPNHQNSLMDALAVLSSLNWQPIFVARSDIFRKKIIIKILTFLKILPVYRIRDGIAEVQKNNAVFQKTIDIFKNRNGFCILPEGDHGVGKRLRPLKKGIARIGFQAAFDSGENLPIEIQPIGLNYQHHHKRGSYLFIRFGIPFPLEGFRKAYQENPAKSYTLFLQKLRQEMIPLILHIEDDVNYKTIDIITEIAGGIQRAKGRKEKDVFDFQKKLIDVCQEKIKESEENCKMLEQTAFESERLINSQNVLLYEAGFMRESPFKNFGRYLLLLLASPFFLYGFFNTLLPRLLIRFIGGKLKDPQFISSAHFVLTIFLYPLFFLLQSLAVGLTTGNGFWALFYFISLPFAGFVKDLWRDSFEKATSISKIRRVANPLKEIFKQQSDILGIQIY
ncbi:MAG: 1-acyl-sn-glycerol-3-phosphate acyltransferase [Bacteroidota bacterium]